MPHGNDTGITAVGHRWHPILERAQSRMPTQSRRSVLVLFSSIVIRLIRRLIISIIAIIIVLLVVNIAISVLEHAIRLINRPPQQFWIIIIVVVVIRSCEPQ